MDNSDEMCNGEAGHTRNFTSIFLPEINKINLHYYGSKDQLLKEIIRTKKQDSFVIHPHSLFRRYWLWIMILVTGINMFALPLDVSFFGRKTYIGWTVFNVFTDIVFIVDLSLNFRTAYIHGQAKATLDRQSIRNNYLKTWFLPDLLAVAPVDYCLSICSALGAFDSSDYGSIMKFTSIFSLLRLLRVFRLVHYVNNCMEMLSIGMKSKLELTYTIFGIFLICHWNACFQFMLQSLMDYPPNSWVTLEGLVAKPIHAQYAKAMFRSLCHMMTLNYGSEIPKGISELWMMIISITTGTVLYALVLAKITALASMSNPSQRAYEDKRNELQVYVRHKHLPDFLIPRMFSHMVNCYQGKWFEEKAILDDLSEPLKLEVMQHICGDLMRRVFGDKHPLFVNELLLALEFESYHIGDVVIRPGVVAECMFLIDKGSILLEHAGVKHTLIDGDYFGEIALAKLCKHSIRASALSPCRLCTLSAHTYRAVLKNFPELVDKYRIRPSFTDP